MFEEFSIIAAQLVKLLLKFVGGMIPAYFLFDFGMLQLLVESKSSLLKLDAKQQVPNMESTNTFFNRTISEAYTQLNSSYEELKGKIEVPIIKIILLYDEFSNTAIIELSEKEIFEKDNLCFVMTIRELEILLYLHCNDKTKEEQILNKLLDSTKSDGLRKRQNSVLLFSLPLRYILMLKKLTDELFGAYL